MGSRELIERARIYRKALGGGMRQAGVLAAAGIIALEEMTKRLAEDHANARLIAEAVARMPQAMLDLESVQTNIVIFDLKDRGDALALDGPDSSHAGCCCGTCGLAHNSSGDTSRCGPRRVRVRRRRCWKRRSS